MKVSSELPPPSRESNGKRSRQSSRSESTHSNRKGSSIRSSRAINKADPLDILKAENDKDTEKNLMEEIKEEIKPQVIDREAIEEEETRKILKAFDRRQVAKEQPPPLPPRTKKWPCYNCRKRCGCAHVDLELAILEGNATACRSTLNRLQKQRPMEINQIFADGSTPIIMAIKSGNENVVDVMLTNPVVDLAVRDKRSGLSPIHLAIILGLTKTARRMIDRPKTDLEVMDDRGMTPIMLAAMTGNDEIFQNLLERKVSIKVKDNQGWDLLACAAYGGNLATVTWCLEQGFEKEIEDPRGMNAEDWAMYAQQGEVAAYISSFIDKYDDYDPDRIREANENKYEGVEKVDSEDEEDSDYDEPEQEEDAANEDENDE